MRFRVTEGTEHIRVSCYNAQKGDSSFIGATTVTIQPDWKAHTPKIIQKGWFSITGTRPL